jgi:hypothetical protein
MGTSKRLIPSVARPASFTAPRKHRGMEVPTGGSETYVERREL